MHIYSTYGASLTFPAVRVTMGRKIMPSLASGTFAQTAASTAMTAPDYDLKTKKPLKNEIIVFLLC